MKTFPDESSLQRSADGTEVIRGGSIGLNRILSFFVDNAVTDRKPQFTGVLISAFTVFRNIWSMNRNASLSDLANSFAKDINLFLEYFDTYLAFTTPNYISDKYVPVVVYFPNYRHVDKNILLEHTGNELALYEAYMKFLAVHGQHEGPASTMEKCKCFWITAGNTSYPHIEAARKFKELANNPKSMYSQGDNVALISHAPLDHHIGARIRNVKILESYTGKLKPISDSKFRLDKEGRVPFLSITHVVLGDKVLIKPMVKNKARRELLEEAGKDKWITRSVEDIRFRIAKALGVSMASLRKYDFD